MALEFANVFKGVITQTTLAALFERGGYRVTRLGIEELFWEVKHNNLEQYLGLNLPLPLRYLPDPLVAELDMSNAFMVEAAPVPVVSGATKAGYGAVHQIGSDLGKSIGA